MADPIISVENLGKRYRIWHQQQPYQTLRDSLTAAAQGWIASRSAPTTQSEEDFWALKDVSFEINQGDVVGVIGRNGAGKSTLLKILSRITEPTTGRIRLKGRVASLLEVGTGFHPELTGRENIFLNGAILGMSKAEIRSKFDEIVAFAEVEKFLDTPVKHYSSGMYTRLAFSVAAHLRSEILIVDEVLAVGDAAFRHKCLAKMQTAAEKDRTVLFVSHDLAAIQKLTKTTLLLSHGRLQSFANTETCLAEYVASCSRSEPTTLPHPLNSCPVILTELRLEDSNGRNTRSLKLTEPFDVKIRFSCEQPLRNAVIGIAIHTPNDVALFATHTNDFGTLLECSPGDWEAVCHVAPNLLRAGTYRISVGVLDRNLLVYHVADACRLTIEPILLDGSGHYDDRIGELYMPMRWAVTPATL